MAVAGRKPEAHGKIARRREPTQSGTVVAMDAPDDLTDEAKMIWDTLLPDLIALRTFVESDALLLSELCAELATARAFRRQVETLEPDFDAALREKDFERADALSGMLKRARTGRRQAMQTVLAIAGEFGITPAARLRLGLMKAQGSSLLGLLRDKGGAS